METVEIDNLTGGQVHVFAAEGPQVVLERTMHGTPVSEPGEEVESSDGTLDVEARCRGLALFGGCRVDYEVAVPAGVSVEVETSSGQISVVGLEGSLELSTLSGGVEVEGADGPVAAETTSGDISLGDVTGSVQAHTTSGGITVAGEGEHLSVSSTSGEVDAAEFAAQEVTAETTSGRIRVGPGFATAEISAVSGKVEAVTDTSFETLAVETVSGDIALEVPEGSYDIGGESVSGGRDIGVGTSPEGPRITADTVSGSLSIDAF